MRRHLVGARHCGHSHMPLEARGPENVSRLDAPPTTIRLCNVTLGDDPLADAEWLDFAKQAAGALYTAVDMGRRLAPPTEHDRAAQHHLIVATAAIAAIEMETLRAVCALGLHPPAQIHARALGLLARNAVVFHEDSALALECYESLEPSRLELSRIAQKVLNNSELDTLLEKRYDDVAGASMRKLEQSHAALFQRHEHYLMSAYEQNLWSKWAHGDIVALADVADDLRRADDDLRFSLTVKVNMALGLLFRAGLFASVLLAVLVDRRCLPQSAVETIIARHRALTAKITIFKESRESMERAVRE